MEGLNGWGIDGTGTAIVISITTGTYSGNGAANRAIPHGLTAKPTFVFIRGTDGDYNEFHILDAANMFYHLPSAYGIRNVTAIDSTNFYVGDAADYPSSANDSAGPKNYIWMAISNMTHGTYSGDGNTNRAIPHGLGHAPKFVYIQGTGGADWVNGCIVGSNHIYTRDSGALYDMSVTAPDATNFYVGDPANTSHSQNHAPGPRTYSWVAL